MVDRAPTATSMLCSGATPIRPATGCGATTYDPGPSATKNAPSAPVMARATSTPDPSRTTTTAPLTGRGAQAGSAGTFSTGHVGPAVAEPPTPLEGVGETPTAGSAQPTTMRMRIPTQARLPGRFVRAVMP